MLQLGVYMRKAFGKKGERGAMVVETKEIIRHLTLIDRLS